MVIIKPLYYISMTLVNFIKRVLTKLEWGCQRYKNHILKKI